MELLKISDKKMSDEKITLKLLVILKTAFMLLNTTHQKDRNGSPGD